MSVNNVLLADKRGTAGPWPPWYRERMLSTKCKQRASRDSRPDRAAPTSNRRRQIQCTCTIQKGERRSSLLPLIRGPLRAPRATMAICMAVAALRRIPAASLTEEAEARPPTRAPPAQQSVSCRRARPAHHALRCRFREPCVPHRRRHRRRRRRRHLRRAAGFCWRCDASPWARSWRLSCCVCGSALAMPAESKPGGVDAHPVTNRRPGALAAAPPPLFIEEFPGTRELVTHRTMTYEDCYFVLDENVAVVRFSSRPAGIS